MYPNIVLGGLISNYTMLHSKSTGWPKNWYTFWTP